MGFLIDPESGGCIAATVEEGPDIAGVRFRPAMKSSHTIMLTLFTESTEPRRDPFIVILSVLMHVVILFVLSFALMYTPRVNDRGLTRRYSVHLLDLHAPLLPFKPSAAKDVLHSTQQSATHASSGGGKPSARQLAIPEQMAKLKPAPQILLQPSVPPDVLLPEQPPLPSMMTWLEQKFQDRKIVLLSQQPPRIARVQPALDPPNPKLKLSDVGISSTAFFTKTLALMPSTTTPIAVNGPEQPGKQLLATASQPSSLETSGSVISFSHRCGSDGEGIRWIFPDGCRNHWWFRSGG
jgi:hypothetical protein